jgi:hypothetical protein
MKICSSMYICTKKKGPTTLLGGTCAPLDHCFILKILKIFLKHLSKKKLIFKFS